MITTNKPRDEAGFYERVSIAAKHIKENIVAKGYFRIVTHFDADGLTAAGIIAKSLIRQGSSFRIRVAKQLDEALFSDLTNEESTPLIFTDFGSGSLDILNLVLLEQKNTDIIILDHHQPINDPITSCIHVNPHLFGINGAKEISGAGLAYVLAKALDRNNIDLAYLAVIGALGDSQDKNPQQELIGFNQDIVADAVKAKKLVVEKDLLFFGRETRPIHKALSYTSNPFLPGLSGQEDKCLGFLLNLGIPLKNGDHWRALNDLNDDEKKKIFSEITKLLVIKNQSHTLALNLIGDVYTLIDEERGTALRDAREYSSLLNACGRMDKSGLGIAIAIGNRGSALDEALAVLLDYKKTLSEYLEWIRSTPTAVKELESMYLLNGIGHINEKLLGPVTSILLSTNTLKMKPIIALASTENGRIKLSGRCPMPLLEYNINLGQIFQRASSKFNGSGGGHDVAAGAQLPEKYFNEIIQFINQQLGDKNN